MNEFIDYLSKQTEACKEKTARLEKEGRKDEADFSKVRTNIYEVCKTVTGALIDRPGAGADAVWARFEGFKAEWGAALEKARANDDARNTVIGETKMKALEDVIAHFPGTRG